MPGREAKDNVIKALNLIHKSRTDNLEGMLLSTDAEKAFDRVSWDFLFANCTHIGLRPHMMNWIKTLYQNPTAQVKVNGTLSETVHIRNGTHQGCPLSPLLFILTLEPLIHTINITPSIQGFLVEDVNYKCAAYAGDLLFFITQPHVSMPNLCKVFDTYSYVSNLKINYIKSKALNVMLSDAMRHNILNNCKFKWESTALKYLGILLTSQLDSLYKHNFQPLLQTITKDLESWTLKHFSWFGRAAIIKITILPRILYYFQTNPIKLPSIFFRSLNVIFRKFLWAAKKPRVSLQILTRSKQGGGMGFPNLKNYYLATHLTRVIDWTCHTENKNWVALENKLGPIPVTYSAWIPWEACPSQLKQHLIIGATLSCVQVVARTTDLTMLTGPLTPLSGHPGFYTGDG